MIVMMRHELQNHCFWATFFFLLIVARVETCHRQIWVSSNHHKYQYYTLANIVNDRHDDCFSVVKKIRVRKWFPCQWVKSKFFVLSCQLFSQDEFTLLKIGWCLILHILKMSYIHQSTKKLICGAVVQKIRACHDTEWNSPLLRARGHS